MSNLLRLDRRSYCERFHANKFFKYGNKCLLLLSNDAVCDAAMRQSEIIKIIITNISAERRLPIAIIIGIIISFKHLTLKKSKKKRAKDGIPSTVLGVSIILNSVSETGMKNSFH